MYRKTSSTYAHSYKILLFDSQNSAFSLSLSQIHTCSPPQNTAHAFECRALFSIRGIHRFLHIQRRMLITLHYRERRKHFISYRLYARITTEWETVLLLQLLLRYAIYSRGSDRSKSHKRSPPIRSFCVSQE